MKVHSMRTVVVNHTPIHYFYIRERNDVYGNPRFRVFISDPEAPAVYEKIFRTYDSLIGESVREFIEASTDKEVN